jgi:hypothetical protein
MAEPINLNKVRKARDKAAKETGAAANRAKFGRTGLQKALDAARADIETRRLDSHARDPKR